MFTSLALEQGPRKMGTISNRLLFSFLVLESPVGPDLAPTSAPSRGKEGCGRGEYGVPHVHCASVCTQSSPEDQLLSLYVIYTVGYALSFSALVIASAILLSFR